MSNTTPTISAANKSRKAQLTIRPSDERGFADHDWLKTYHTFSFASYYDPRHAGFGPLYVINEDRVDAGTGFGLHPHREMEIFSYVVSGQLQHNDSLRNSEVIGRGALQMTSTGTGIRHAEANRHPTEACHFLQIWVKPSQYGLSPSYYTRHFTDAEKRDTFLPIVAPLGFADNVVDVREATGPAPIHAGLTAYASILTSGKTVAHIFAPHIRRGYLHLVTTAFRPPGVSPTAHDAQLTLMLGGEEVTLKEGDGVYIDLAKGTSLEVESTGGTEAEFVLFEMTS